MLAPWPGVGAQKLIRHSPALPGGAHIPERRELVKSACHSVSLCTVTGQSPQAWDGVH